MPSIFQPDHVKSAYLELLPVFVYSYFVKILHFVNMLLQKLDCLLDVKTQKRNKVIVVNCCNVSCFLVSVSIE